MTHRALLVPGTLLPQSTLGLSLSVAQISLSTHHTGSSEEGRAPGWLSLGSQALPCEWHLSPLKEPSRSAAAAPLCGARHCVLLLVYAPSLELPSPGIVFR